MAHAVVIKGEIGRTVEYSKGTPVELSEGETLLTVDTLNEKARPMVQAIQNAAEQIGAEKATKEAQERLKALKEAFPGDPALAMEAFVSGKTAEQVKAEQYDMTAKELAEAKKKLAEAQRAPKFRASDDEDKPEEEDDDEDKPSEEDDDEDKTSEEDDDEDKSEEDSEDDKQTERRAKAEWQKSKKIRQEFGSFKTFVAYKKAERKKAFKVLRK